MAAAGCRLPFAYEDAPSYACHDRKLPGSCFKTNLTTLVGPHRFQRLHWSLLGVIKPFKAVNVCNHLVSGSFHTPLGVLFSFPSPYWCTIGLRKYLALEVNNSRLPAPYPRRSTQELKPNSRRLTLTGLSPFIVGLSRPLQLRRQRGGLVHNTTSHVPFSTRFSLGCSLFSRR